MTLTYDDVYNANRDAKQTKLTKTGCKKNTFRFRENKAELKFDMIVTCPFCLNHNPVFKFIKKHGLYECPICTNQMWGKTIITDLYSDEQIEDFAIWVFEYRLNGFWEKINKHIKDRGKAFELWKNRLFELKISKVFWEKYKELRGDVYETEEDT